MTETPDEIRTLFDRDLSWLSFNERVLMEAGDRSVPLYERIKFVAIFSSNIDEFFRVRFADIRRIARLNKKKLSKSVGITDPEQLIHKIRKTTLRQQRELGRIYAEEIIPDLQKEGIVLYQDSLFHEGHAEFVEEYFYSSILSFLRPRLCYKKDDVFFKDRALYFAVELSGGEGDSILGVVNIPSDHLPRFVELPSIDGVCYYAHIDDIVRLFLPVIFQGFEILNCTSVKLNRDAELYLGDEFGEDIVQKIQKTLARRDVGVPARFLYQADSPESLLKMLMEIIGLESNDMVRGGRYHSMFDHFGLPNPKGSHLLYKSRRPLSHRTFKQDRSVLQTVAKKDVLLHFPYQRYDYVLRFFNEASLDPKVKEIKASIYRVAEESHVVNALISAAENGKKVTVFVEAKARFDEANNLKWAKRMREVDIDVHFSDVDLKVHAKVALVKGERSDGTAISYAFLGTGNFNEKSAEVYADHALLTSNEELTAELDSTFDLIFGIRKEIALKHLLVSQVNLVPRLKALIDTEIANVKEGRRGQIVLKLNNIQDPIMIRRLYAAAAAGVEVVLIVRAICCIKPVKNIRLVRLVDKNLEHARVYRFHNDGKQIMYLGSADWMERNLYRRIEVAFPIAKGRMKREINKCLELQLNDNTKLVEIGEGLQNIPVEQIGDPIRAQVDFGNWLESEYNVPASDVKNRAEGEKSVG